MQFGYIFYIFQMTCILARLAEECNNENTLLLLVMLVVGFLEALLSCHVLWLEKLFSYSRF